MIKTAADMLAFWVDQAAMIPRPSASGDAALRALQTYESFKAWALVGLVKWRGNLGDPTRDFLAAIDVLAAIPAGATAAGGLEYAAALDASLLAFLCGPPRPALEALSPRARPEADVELDARLEESIWTSTIAGDWDAPIGRARATARTTLVADTYRNYRDVLRIVLRQSNGNLDAALKRGCELYLKRKGNGFYSGGVATSGGGPDNAFVVDFRLAALSKWAKQRGAASDPVSADPHAWRW